MVSDIDGTLLDSGNRLTPAVVRAIERVRQAGLRVCLASGRSGVLLEPIRRNLGLTTPFIACGGAYAADPERGAVILDAPIPQESARRAVTVARAHGLGVLFEEPHAAWIEADADTTRRVLELTGGRVTPTADLLSQPGALPRKITLMGGFEALQRTRRALDGRDPALHVVFSTAVYLDITLPGVNKGTALERLTRYLGVPLERTVAIGDGPNDLEMFERAGLSVAMANAPPHVRAAAQWVAPAHDEDGVAWAMHALLGDSAEAWEREA